MGVGDGKAVPDWHSDEEGVGIVIWGNGCETWWIFADVQQVSR